MEYTTEGYPFPDAPDLGDGPSDMAAFALAQDAKFPGWDAAFIASSKQKSFRFRTPSNSISIPPLNSLGLSPTTTDFNNTGAVNLSGGGFGQPSGDGQSWWYMGGMVFVIAAATPTVGTMHGAALSISDFNPDTQKNLFYYLYGDSIETNTGGEFISFQGIVKLYGTASAFLNYANGGSTNAVAQAGSMMWGTRLGSA
jgi:hypothetical protein